MKPKTITLVRHGESHGNIDRKLFKTTADDLMDITPEGEKQAEAAVPTLQAILGNEDALFYTSPYLRCKRTTAIIRSGLDGNQILVIEDNNLRERKIGNLVGVDELDIIRQELNAQGFFYRPPAGESFAEVFTRSEIFRASMKGRWESDHHPEHVVIIGHNSALKTFLMGELCISPSHFSEFRNIRNAEIITLKPTDGRFGVQYLPASLPIGITKKHINSAIS